MKQKLRSSKMFIKRPCLLRIANGARPVCASAMAPRPSQAALPARAAGRPQRTPMASFPDAGATTTEAELVRRRMPELLGVASPRAARHGKRCLPAPLFCFPGVSSGRPRRTPSCISACTPPLHYRPYDHRTEELLTKSRLARLIGSSRAALPLHARPQRGPQPGHALDTELSRHGYQGRLQRKGGGDSQRAPHQALRRCGAYSEVILGACVHGPRSREQDRGGPRCILRRYVWLPQHPVPEGGCHISDQARFVFVRWLRHGTWRSPRMAAPWASALASPPLPRFSSPNLLLSIAHRLVLSPPPVLACPPSSYLPLRASS